MASSSCSDEYGPIKNKNRLALEQAQAIKNADLQAEVAKLEQVDEQISHVLQQIKRQAEKAEALLSTNRGRLPELKSVLYTYPDEDPEDVTREFFDATAQYKSEYEIHNNPVGHEDVGELSKQVAVAVHLVEVQTSTRAKMLDVVKG